MALGLYRKIGFKEVDIDLIIVMKMAMDTVDVQVEDLTKMMEQSVIPHVGGQVDISL